MAEQAAEKTALFEIRQTLLASGGEI